MDSVQIQRERHEKVSSLIEKYVFWILLVCFQYERKYFMFVVVVIAGKNIGRAQENGGKDYET